MLEQVTPLLLTYNEAPNIGRTLERLAWAREIIIVDSFSDDETLEIAARFSQTRIFQRKFDTHRNQWNFALKETNMSSEWVLALDADYVLTPALLNELKELEPTAEIQGYRARFVYCVYGQPLSGSAYPPVTVLYRRAGAAYVQDGHTQRISVAGEVRNLMSPMLHDDRKPLAHWVQAQNRYMKLEAEKLWLADLKLLGWADRLRRMRVVAPFIMFFYCLLVKGALLNGRVGIYYVFQRLFSELLLSLYLLEHDLNNLRQRVDK